MIMNFKDKKPFIHESCFIAENSVIIGETFLEEKVNVWFGAVIRADFNKIYIGKGTNIQDNCTLHVNSENSPIYIGEYVTVGHNCILHGCKIESNVLIGMGSTIMDDVEIGADTIIGANSLIPSGKKIPSKVLCMGSPAKVIRELSDVEIENIRHSAKHYIELAGEY